MTLIQKTVFISYRRTSSAWALAIYQHLTQHGYDVFIDFQSIPSGDFEQVIFQNIGARAHFLVLLTPSALEHVEEPNDWMRREIETALDTRRNVVPIMLEGFDFGNPDLAKHLVGKLAILKNYNALPVPREYFGEAMARLRERFLNVPLDTILHPLSSMAMQATKEQQVVASSAPAVTEKELAGKDDSGNKPQISVKQVENLINIAKTINSKPNTAVGYIARGRAYLAMHSLDEAIHDFSEAIRLKPDYVDAYLLRGSVHTVKGDMDNALHDFSKVIRLKPDSAMAYQGRAETSYYKGDLDSALRDYNQAIRLQPDYADAYSRRGNAHSKKGDLGSALRDYNEAIRLKPDLAMAYIDRANAYKAKGNLDSALRDYNEAIRLKPDYALAYNDRGVAHYIKGDMDSALRDYTEAIRLKPQLAMVYNNRGFVYKQQGNLDLAIRDYQTYLDLGGGTQNNDQQAVKNVIRELREKL